MIPAIAEKLRPWNVLNHALMPAVPAPIAGARPRSSVNPLSIPAAGPAVLQLHRTIRTRQQHFRGPVAVHGIVGQLTLLASRLHRVGPSARGTWSASRNPGRLSDVRPGIRIRLSTRRVRAVSTPDYAAQQPVM